VEKASSLMQMEMYTKGIGKMIKQMEKEYIITRMEQYSKDIGRKINK